MHSSDLFSHCLVPVAFVCGALILAILHRYGMNDPVTGEVLQRGEAGRQVGMFVARWVSKAIITIAVALLVDFLNSMGWGDPRARDAATAATGR